LSLVVDASIAIKWVVPEADTKEALALRQTRLFAPDLLIPECANILWKKVRRNELMPAEALFAARLIERADIELQPMRSLMEPAARLAMALDHPAYDCIYLALAQALESEFITADQAFYQKTASHGERLPVRLLRPAHQR
jgi:predicted nucleic acid-binding protein